MQLVGILNYTPDSFYDGNQNFEVRTALAAAHALVKDGAAIIDIGAEATNPFVKPITATKEIERLKPILPELLKTFPNQISLDTYHPETLAWALQFGKPILNDVSGLYDPRVIQLAKTHELICIVGHLPPQANGLPTAAHEVKIDDFNVVVEQMKRRAEALIKNGIKKTNIILDPNIGFGKTMRLNWQLVKEFSPTVGYPVMIGASHKRFLGFDEDGIELANGQNIRHTSKRNLLAAQYAKASGAMYLRVHEPSWYKNLA